jgi:Zn-finger nucleic acid-binding protein
MECPACRRELTTMTVADVTVDVCAGGCGGMWFDDFELKKVEDADRSAGHELLQVARDPGVAVDPEAKRECPRCGIPLMRHFESFERKVTLDECGSCAGVWLDAGELGTIEHEYGSDGERQSAAEAYFSEMFDGKLKAMAQESDEKVARARRFAHMFRFICPTYYIPGKQDRGAF